MGSLLLHLESVWIFSNQLHALVEFFLIENLNVFTVEAPKPIVCKQCLKQKHVCSTKTRP